MLTQEQLERVKGVLANLLNELFTSEQADDLEGCVQATIEPISETPFLKQPFLAYFDKGADISDAIKEKLLIIREGNKDSRVASKDAIEFLKENLTSESKKLIDLFSFFTYLKAVGIRNKRSKMLMLIRALYLEIEPKYNRDMYGNVLDDVSFSFVASAGVPLKLTKYGPPPVEGDIRETVVSEVEDWVKLFRKSQEAKGEARLVAGTAHNYFQQPTPEPELRQIEARQAKKQSSPRYDQGEETRRCVLM